MLRGGSAKYLAAFTLGLLAILVIPVVVEAAISGGSVNTTTGILKIPTLATNTLNFTEGANGDIRLNQTLVIRVNGTYIAIERAVDLNAALTATGQTITGGTFSGPTLSGTVAGTYTISGTPTLGVDILSGGTGVDYGTSTGLFGSGFFTTMNATTGQFDTIRTSTGTTITFTTATAVNNVGNAGNDFGATNALVATTFSGTVDVGSQAITTTGTVGRSGDARWDFSVAGVISAAASTNVTIPATGYLTFGTIGQLTQSGSAGEIKFITNPVASTSKARLDISGGTGVASGSSRSVVSIWGSGSPGDANFENLLIEALATSAYRITLNSGGTGTIRDLQVFRGAVSYLNTTSTGITFGAIALSGVGTVNGRASTNMFFDSAGHFIVDIPAGFTFTVRDSTNADLLSIAEAGTVTLGGAGKLTFGVGNTTRLESPADNSGLIGASDRRWSAAYIRNAVTGDISLQPDGYDKPVFTITEFMRGFTASGPFLINHLTNKSYMFALIGTDGLPSGELNASISRSALNSKVTDLEAKIAMLERQIAELRSGA